MIGTGRFWVGVVLLTVGGLMDTLDGVVAKAAGTASKRGAFFDSVADRVADALIFGGMAWYLASGHDPRLALLPFAILGVSAVISYERAKAESLGYDAKGGLMERAERLILLGIALALHVILVPLLALVARAVGVHRCAAFREGLALRRAGRATRRPSPPRALAPWARRVALAVLASAAHDGHDDAGRPRRAGFVPDAGSSPSECGCAACSPPSVRVHAASDPGPSDAGSALVHPSGGTAGPVADRGCPPRGQGRPAGEGDSTPASLVPHLSGACGDLAGHPATVRRRSSPPRRGSPCPRSGVPSGR